LKDLIQMIKILSRNIVRFIFLVVLQIFIFNNIQFNGYINPYFYILFIILLPFETPGWLLLILSFLLGFSIDVFSQTLGIHASACVFMAFFRPAILRMLIPRDEYEIGTYPRIYYYGFSWFLKYTIALVFIHHLFLFYIEIFTFSDFFLTLLRVILSSIFSISLIVLSQYFIYKK